MASPMPGMVRTWTCGEAGKSAKAVDQQLPEVLLGLLAVPDLGHEIADQRLGQLAAQRRDRLLRGLMHRLGLLAGEIGDLLQGGELGLGDAFGGGILVEQLEHPAGGDVLGQGGEFGEDAGQEVVQSVDGLGRLLDLGLQASGDLAQQDHGRGRGWGGVGLLDDGEAGHGLALGVVGGALGEVGLLVVLVAFGLADGDGHGQVEAAEEVFEIDGVLTGGVDADVEMSLGMLFMQLIEAFLQGLIAGTVLHHGEGLGGRLAIGSEEGDAMTVACGVDADADAVEGRGGRHGRPPE